MEPRSCAVTRLESQPKSRGDGKPCIFEVDVTYHPKGHISFVGETMYDGWTAMMPDRKQDGTLLDGKGQPLEDGEQPVLLPFEVYPDHDFNALDFGKFVGEIDIEDVKREVFDDVLTECMQREGGGFSTSMQGAFIAPRRNRPQTKIILTNSPDGEGVDGFGTRIININLSTPHLEQVMMDKLTKLMCDCLEGKASIKSVGNQNVAFMELADALVDCSPNEMGFDSMFNMLQCYTPITFLDNLAKKLMAMYEVDISVVQGKNAGLVLRRESKK